MNSNKNSLQTFFQNTKGISQDKAKYYVGWLNRFLEYYNGGLDNVFGNGVKFLIVLSNYSSVRNASSRVNRKL